MAKRKGRSQGYDKGGRTVSGSDYIVKDRSQAKDSGYDKEKALYRIYDDAKHHTRSRALRKIFER